MILIQNFLSPQVQSRAVSKIFRNIGGAALENILKLKININPAMSLSLAEGQFCQKERIFLHKNVSK